jgi:DNA-binding NtrC family response regulator
LLRVLQSKEIHIVGSSHVRKVDTRIIAATHKDLPAMVAKQHFREDLFYRLDVIDIHIPPLRERQEDILPLTTHFLNKLAKEMDRAVPKFSDQALNSLKKYAWPGNVRELENLIQRLLVNTDGETIDIADLPELMRDSMLPAPLQMQSLAAMEVYHIQGVLDAVGGNKTRAAQILGIDRKTLREKLKRFKAT